MWVCQQKSLISLEGIYSFVNRELIFLEVKNDFVNNMIQDVMKLNGFIKAQSVYQISNI